MSEIFYTNQMQTVVRNLSPTVKFSYQVPASFTHQFLLYMSRGLIRVYDRDGNQLKVEMP